MDRTALKDWFEHTTKLLGQQSFMRGNDRDRDIRKRVAIQ